MVDKVSGRLQWVEYFFAMPFYVYTYCMYTCTYIIHCYTVKMEFVRSMLQYVPVFFNVRTLICKWVSLIILSYR